ncbi:uncharacterized protein TRIVIDRAFT_53037 [Trichoderma virens Gv29-8]|uniref:Uncharacterized protein n=1 Tax=Hypocrea virens (strain Gv29-8 / FGSC 10586) TaxID=413071 RepID=G9MV16_HYPVG|nr:uncharacterized protein TRIVIDRAFT_53037 [Trichoderma virens Gv29-8]EHK21741.1 hypothetical protein TRIVIDRAFT_53037 [Trichoderma virens Gv29-8]UKZ55833.1 hypothetical protein TrVGV298_009657 [Trichoderma virens]
MSVITWRESFPPKPQFAEKDIPDQYGRVFIITGGSSGCGYEVAKAVYNLNGRVYIAARSSENGQQAIQRIKSEPAAQHPSVKSGKGELFFLKLDLNDLSSIKDSAKEFLSRESRLDVIWHNAGVGGVPQGCVTKQGYETHFGVNALAPFLFQHFLNPICLQTASRSDVRPYATRVIWVSSSGHRGSPKPDGVNWDDMNMHSASGLRAIMKYGQSKAMNVMCAYEFARRYGPRGLVSLSLHPGSLKSGFQRNQGSIFKAITKPLLYDQHYGGLTELFAAFNRDVNTTMIDAGGRNGAYIEPWGNWGTMGEHILDGLSNRKTGERLLGAFEIMLKEYIQS